VTGGLYLANHVDPTSSTNEIISFAIPWFLCTCVCNISIVFTIAVRLLWYRQLVRRVVGSRQGHHSELYERVLAILVESAALYVAFMIAYVVSYALQSSVARLLQATMSNVRVSAISFFHLRVRLGVFWDIESEHAILFSGNRFVFDHTPAYENVGCRDVVHGWWYWVYDDGVYNRVCDGN
jgi:hypothetical protein